MSLCRHSQSTISKRTFSSSTPSKSDTASTSEPKKDVGSILIGESAAKVHKIQPSLLQCVENMEPDVTANTLEHMFRESTLSTPKLMKIRPSGYLLMPGDAMDTSM
jgi:hypothetical protein